MAQEEITYEEATAQIEEILGRFRNNEVSIDQLAQEVERATKLITLCRSRLTATEEEVKKILE